MKWMKTEFRGMSQEIHEVGSWPLRMISDKKRQFTDANWLSRLPLAFSWPATPARSPMPHAPLRVRRSGTPLAFNRSAHLCVTRRGLNLLN